MKIREISTVNRALLLDGFWEKSTAGFHVILYDLSSHQLVRWLDSSVVPYLKVRSSSLRRDFDRNYILDNQVLYDAISENNLQICRVRTLESNIYTNYLLNKQAEIVNSAVNFDMLYFHDLQLTPGTLVKVRDGEISKLDTAKISIKDKLREEAEELIELAEINMPLLEMNIPDLKRVAFDIEVRAPRGIFPVPEKAAFPVHAIGLYGSDNTNRIGNNSIIWILGYHPTKSEMEDIRTELGYIPEIRFFLSEIKLLNNFFEEIVKYPVILSYNGDNFDMPYLYNRSVKLGIAPPIAEGFTNGFYRNRQYHFIGTIHLDLFRFFSNNSVRLYAFSGKYSRLRLDDVAEALLGYKKVEHELWFDEMSRSQMVSYTIRDVELTLKLTTFSNNLTLAVMVMIMRVGKMTLTQVNRASISNWIMNWIAFEHSRRGWVIPTKQELKAKGVFDSDAGIEGKQYQGAIVFEPEPGVFWDVIVADYASLYPSVIKKYRLSYETLRCNHKQCRQNTVPELSHWVCEKSGIMSSLVGYVRDVRVNYYKYQAKKAASEQERELASTIQAALKVFINASYGVFGNRNFALFCPPVAESTTAFARNALLEARRIAEDMGYDVLYGDTDSIFIHQISEGDFGRLQDWSVNQLGIELGIDYRFRYLVLSGRKKNYFGIKTDSGTITKGLTVKKSNTTQFIKDLYQEILEILIKVYTPEDLETALSKVKSKIRTTRRKVQRGSIPVDQLTRMVTLSKNFGEYASATPAVQVAIQKMTPENVDEYQQGQQFIVVPTRPRTYMVQVDKFPSFPKGYTMECKYQSITELDIADINWSKFEIELQKAFRPIFDAFDLEWEKDIQLQTTLDQFW